MDRIRPFGAWIWLALAIFIIGLVAALSAGSTERGRPLATDNAHGGGGRALFLWLQRSGYDVNQTGRTDFRLPELDPARDTLLLLDLQGNLTSPQIRAIHYWINVGGTALVGSDGLGLDTLSRLGLSATLAASARVQVVQPLFAAPSTSQLSGQADLVSVEALPAGEVARTPFGAVLVKRQIGSGVLWLFTAPHLLDNGHIAAGENRRLALNLVRRPGSRVEFAEPQDMGASSTGEFDWVTGTVWGIALLFALIVGLIFRWLGGWRLGPPVVPFGERRRPAVEYVLSLADLLMRSQRRSEVLGVYQRGLRQTITRRFGSDDTAQLSPELAREVQSLLEHPHALSGEELLERTARILNCEEEIRGSRV